MIEHEGRMKQGTEKGRKVERDEGGRMKCKSEGKGVRKEEQRKEGRKTLTEGVRKDETRKEVMIVIIYYLQSDCIKMSFLESSNHHVSCPASDLMSPCSRCVQLTCVCGVCHCDGSCSQPLAVDALLVSERDSAVQPGVLIPKDFAAERGRHSVV